MARSTFRIQNLQSTSLSEHFWKLRCWKIARPCGPVSRSTFPSQNVKSTTCSDHFWRFRCGFAWQVQGIWVGKMCCKAPGGKCAKSISKSRKAKSRKVKRCLCENFQKSKVESKTGSFLISKSRKVYYFSLFDFLIFCRMPFQPNMRSPKYKT